MRTYIGSYISIHTTATQKLVRIEAMKTCTTNNSSETVVVQDVQGSPKAAPRATLSQKNLEKCPSVCIHTYSTRHHISTVYMSPSVRNYIHQTFMFLTSW